MSGDGTFLSEAANELELQPGPVGKPRKKRAFKRFFKQPFTWRGFIHGYWGPWMLTHVTRREEIAHQRAYYTSVPKPWFDRQIMLVQIFIVTYLLLLSIPYFLMSVVRGLFFHKPRGLHKKRLDEVNQKWK